ncbi:hypothetical protein KBD81_01365 [Candidatus Woesebacteria bacterium]|nr:hypothetical protein [Candidatus Woesebacteria bacterium]
MRQKIVVVAVVLSLVIGFMSLPPTPQAYAGSNGQQLFFYTMSGVKISWIQVSGTYYTGNRATWSKSISPAQGSYSLTNYWWKNQVDIQYRLADGRRGYCSFNVPTSMSGNWVNVGLDRQPGTSCYPSY